MELRIGVTEPEFRKAESVFSRAMADGCQCVPVPAEEQALAVALREGNIPYVVVGVVPYRGPLYAALNSGGVIARFGVGHDGIDKEQATRHGLLCTNTPGALDDSVAEHAIALLLALARQIPVQAASMVAGEWSPRVGTELAGKKLAIIGCGGIGRRVGRIASQGFGMEVVGLKRSQTETRELQEHFGFTCVVTDFEEAVRGADFVSVHLPGGPDTRYYLGRDRLEKLPAGCALINTARGMVIDEPALFDALIDGRIAGAALDVFEKEPYQPQAPEKDLRRLSNVLLTPHCGSSTREACARMAQRALRNIELAAKGRHADMDLLNPVVIARLQL